MKHTHPNYKLLQLKISKKLAELQENTLTLENQGKVLPICCTFRYSVLKSLSMFSGGEIFSNLLRFDVFKETKQTFAYFVQIFKKHL